MRSASARRLLERRFERLGGSRRRKYSEGTTASTTGLKPAQAMDSAGLTCHVFRRWSRRGETEGVPCGESREGEAEAQSASPVEKQEQRFAGGHRAAGARSARLGRALCG